MNKNFIIFSICILQSALSFGMYEVQKNSVAVTANTVAEWQTPGAGNFIPVLTGLCTSLSKAFAAAKALTLLPDIAKISALGSQIRSGTIGMSNTVHGLFERKKQEGTDLTVLKDDIIRAATNVTLNKDIFETLRSVNVPVYLIGIAQDSKELDLWLEQLIKQNSTVKDFFAGKLSYKSYSDEDVEKRSDNHYLFNGQVVDGNIDQTNFADSLLRMIGKTRNYFVDVNDKRIETVKMKIPAIIGINAKTSSLHDELNKAGLLAKKEQKKMVQTVKQHIIPSNNNNYQLNKSVEDID